jgi:hypothetical protein
VNQAAPGGGSVSADQSELDAANAAYEDYAQQFTNTIETVGSAHDTLAAGAASLWSDIEVGAAQFLLGWNESFQACSETCAIIAGNVGNYWLDLADTDVDQTVTFDLSPQP